MQKKLIVKQVDESDCGVCCLLSIIRYFKGNVPLEILKIDTNTNKTGTNAYELIKAGSFYGLEGTCLKIDTLNISFPVIAHIKIEDEFYHFVVIYKVEKNFIILMDPAIGKIKISIDKFMLSFTGYIIQFTPVTEVTYLKSNPTLKKIINIFLKQNKKEIIYLYFIELILIFVVILNSFTIKLLSINLTLFIICFFCCSIIKTLIMFKKNKKVTTIKNTLELNLTKNFFSHLLLLPLKIIHLKTSGEILTRFKELSIICDFIINVLFKNSIEIIICIFTSLIIFVYNAKIGLMLIFNSFVYILLSYLFNKTINPKINKEINNEVEYNSKLTEYINSLETIKSLNNYEYFYHNFVLSLKEKIIHTINLEKIISNSENLKDFLANLTYIILIFYAFYINLSLINVITILNLEMVYFDTLRSLLNDLPVITYIKTSFNKINEFFDIKEQKQIHIYNCNTSITFNNICFSYDQKRTLTYNFNIKSNSFVMIKGKNGSGKSTICKLLTKLLNDYEGNILIGEKNIKDYQESEIRDLISYSNQNTHIFKDTIINNILLNKKIDNETFLKITDICDLESVVKNKKNRYESIIYENSPNFSGGEIQKIILARTLINDSKIIILDETLSAVNLNTEISILKKIKEQFKNKTIIYITHKDLEKYFDEVIYLN